MAVVAAVWDQTPAVRTAEVMIDGLMSLAIRIRADLTIRGG
jgi:hypothetical protein